MSSILEGYNYDVFISYRQNDNKYDGWVTEFVDNLKKELEANIKDKVSVYFDINPTDGLLETDSVDKSLVDKLKCLIFIPIISRTYCDAKSFAWQNEFCAFSKLAKEDKFRREIKLASGNVASRILPIKIHDLDLEDKNLLENELGGVLRGIEFIYKEAGVDRPLTSKDNEEKNLNKTSYRNQINKVALAIKEILSAIKHKEQKTDPIPSEISFPLLIPRKNKKIKILTVSSLLILLLILGILFVPNLIKSKQPEKSIAVLPFHNYSGDPSQEYMSDGLTDEIIGHLYKIKSFDKVVSLSSVLTYKNSDKKTPQIANELKVNYILEGTYKKIGDQVRVTAQLIEPKHDKHLWQNEYDKPYIEIITIQADIALQIAGHLKAFLSNSGKQNIQKVATTNQEAYNLLLKASYLGRRRTSFAVENQPEVDQALDLVLQAIRIDPEYSNAYSMAGGIILGNANYGGKNELKTAGWEALHYFEKALELDPENGNAHYGVAQLNDWFTWDYIKAEKEFLRAIELLPNRRTNITQYGEFLMKMNRISDAQSYFTDHDSSFTSQYREIRRKILAGENEEAGKSIRRFLELWGKDGYIWAGEAYIWLEEFDSAYFYLSTVDSKNDPEFPIPRFQACLALSSIKTNHNNLANAIIRKLKAISDSTSAKSPDFFTGWYYSGIRGYDSAFIWLERAFENRSPEMPWLKVDPEFINLKKDPRYWDLYARTGHKAYDEYMSRIKK